MPIRYTDHDRSLASSFFMEFRSPEKTLGTVLFQFPPKVRNDSRQGDWDEKAVGPNAPDKLAFYKTGDPRRITVEWVYIVDGGQFTSARIHDELRKLRGYFSNPKQEGDGGFNSLVVNFWAWNIGGSSKMSFRFLQANIKHSETIVGTGKSAFPLRTDVAVEMKTWPKFTLGGMLQVANDQIELTPEWY